MGREVTARGAVRDTGTTRDRAQGEIREAVGLEEFDAGLDEAVA